MTPERQKTIVRILALLFGAALFGMWFWGDLWVGTSPSRLLSEHHRQTVLAT